MGTPTDRTTLLVRGLSFIFQARGQIDRYEATAWRVEERGRASQRVANGGSPTPGVGPLLVGDSWALANERYLVMALLAQVEKVASSVLPDGGPPFPGALPLRKVRDMEEHWEEEGRAVETLRQHDASANPATFRFGVDPYWLGDFTTDEVRAWLDDVETLLRGEPEGIDAPKPGEPIEFEPRLPA